MRRHALSIAVGAILAGGACSAEEEEPRLEEVNFISYNSLHPDAFLANGDALDALAGAALNGASTGLVDSADGRSLLSYVVRCALATGDSASFPRAGYPNLVYTGQLGFATAWKSASLSDTGRRLMTGCVMAHVNVFQTLVPISIRNPIVGEANLVEKLLFPAQELAVYGNYFAPASERELYVCFGAAVAQSLGASGGIGDLLPSYLDLRICSMSEECGFQRVGACYRWSSMPEVTEAACETQLGSFYESCHEAPIEDEPSPAWQETVTVYLQPLHLTLLLTEYLDMICDLSGLLC